MKHLLPILTIALLSFTACQSEYKNETDNNTDTGAYVDPATGSAGMTIPDRDTPYIETESPEIMKQTDSSMQSGTTQPQAY